MKPIILCVDDEAVIRDSVKAELKARLGRGYDFETAESGDEALELLEELDADGIPLVVIVSDWLMPGMKGDELLIKVHQRYPGAVTLMLTGQADAAAVRRAEEHAGLFACLYKPMAGNELADVVSAALAQLEDPADE